MLNINTCRRSALLKKKKSTKKSPFRTLTGHFYSTQEHLVHGPGVVIEVRHQPVAVQEDGTASVFLSLENIPNVDVLRHV